MFEKLVEGSEHVVCFHAAKCKITCRLFKKGQYTRKSDKTNDHRCKKENY